MKNTLLIKVLIAIVLAIIAGWLAGPNSELFGVQYFKIFGLLGQLFLNALTLVVVPLVTASIITGTARLGSEQSFGTLGLKTFGYYFLSMSLAILSGLIVFLLISPGMSPENAAALTEKLGNTPGIVPDVSEDTFDRISQILLRIVPPNIIAAAAQGQMLGLIIFSILFGYFLSKIEPHAASVVTNFWKGIFQIMMQITHLVMRALPIGVFGLVAKVIATTGLESVSSTAYFFVTVLVGFVLFACVAMPLVLFFVGGVNPVLHFRAMGPALFTAFSTSSSAATLPVTIDCVEKRAGVSNRICSFTVPLGTSLNMSGTSLYLCVASLFIAHVYGVHLNVTTVAIVLLMALLTSIGVAGIPSASLISAIIILQTLGVPVEGIGLVMAVERFMDMGRTVINVFGNTCCAVLVARSEGEKDVLATTSLSRVGQ